MTIRRRISLSFLGVLTLFAMSVGVYVWSSHLRSQAMEQLNRSLQREVLLSSVRQNLDNIQSKSRC